MAKGKSNLVHKETYQRINYLYQAAYITLTTNPANFSLCRFYTSTLKAIVKRLVLRIHPHIKRSICKKCCVLLVPGITAKVRVKGKGQKCSETTCLACGFKLHLLSNPNHQPWFQNPEAWLPVV